MIIESGFLLVNKPKDVSSFSCVAQIKSLLPKKTKVGHAGTLDPFAHGLLIIGIGREATSKMSHLMKLDKVYVATGKFGEATDTLDKTGRVTQTCDTVVTRQVLEDAIASFRISYTQTPPFYSALKHEGMPLYKLARKQLATTEQLQSITARKSREVTIYSLELLDFTFPYFTVRAHVSHGTYIRSLLDDIARTVGSCATTYALERTRIGQWDVQGAYPVADIADRAQLRAAMLQEVIEHFI